MGFDPLLFGNMVSLCEGISPRVVGSVCREFYPTTGEPSLAMRMLWETLDHPFGTAVHLMHPVTLCPHKSPERTVYYTPYLSGIAVRANTSSPYWSGKSKGASPSSSSTATAEETGSDAAQPAFAWFERDRPDNRVPLTDQIRQLAKVFPALTDAESTSFDHQSWFAVLWQPIHGHTHTPQRSCGSFLAFYLLRAPRHLFGSTSDAPGPASRYADWDSCIFRLDRFFFGVDYWAAKIPWLSSSPSHDAAARIAHLVPQELLGVSADDEWRRLPRQTCQCRVPVVGLIPNRARPDVWYLPNDAQRSQFSFHAPLFLTAAAMQLMRHEEERIASSGGTEVTEVHSAESTASSQRLAAGHSGASSRRHALLPDFYHVVKHERTLLEFYNKYA
jgi:hypothetical protein